MGHPEANRVRRVVGMGLLLAAATVLFWACLQPPLALLGISSDGGSDGGSSLPEGGSPAILGLFTINGCSELTFPDGNPHCQGTAPLQVRLILLAVGSTTHRFGVTPLVEAVDGGVKGGDAGASPDAGSPDAGFPDAGADSGMGSGSDSLLDDAASRSDSPSLLLPGPGVYLVTLGVAGPGGTATAIGQITVLSAHLGAACDTSSGCDPGLQCLCAADSAGADLGTMGRDLGSSCPAGLHAGLCTRTCDGLACPTGSVCVDVSRSQMAAVDGGTASPDPWRQPICVPSCLADSDCRSDLLCRELPLLSAGEKAGGLYTWGRACFVGTPGGIGSSCIGGNEQPTPTACAFGICEPLGLRDICSAPCDVGCPPSAACAQWSGPSPPAPMAPGCVARCDVLHPCSDPLLACQPAASSGSLGFKLPGEPVGSTVCAPRRCFMAVDCPGGQCVRLGGAFFCTR